jgi:hypothetical protein
MAYSGTHEPTKFNEHDSGNALMVEISGPGAPPRIHVVRTGSLEWRTYRCNIEAPGQIAVFVEELDALPAPERTLVDCALTGTLFGRDQEALGKLVEIVERRFLYGRLDAAALLPDRDGNDWFEHLPAGYLQDAAKALLAQSASDPVAGAALIEFARMWREAVQ